MELERGGGGGSDHGGDILIITHQAVLRCIVAYFMGKERGESPWMNVRIAHTFNFRHSQDEMAEEQSKEVQKRRGQIWRDTWKLGLEG